MASVYSVKQVNEYISNMFAQDFLFRRISVRGEVSNCKYHSSGHIFFTLKDESGILSAIMYAGCRKGLAFPLKDGQQVVATGKIGVHVQTGRYRLYANQIVKEGEGDLYEKFLRLREELEDRGLFSGQYKKPIPRYARRVGIVTSETGAVRHDIETTAAERNPYVQLILCPAQVQGENARYSIAGGIRRLDEMGVDVIIVGRGGGSLEELWAFNEEMVAQAIFDCRTPVISAVGHETDVTIADFVADRRAPTPTAAAQMAVFDYALFREQLQVRKDALTRGMDRCLERKKGQAEQERLRLKMHHPERQLSEKRQQLARADGQLRQILDRRLTDRRHLLALLGGKLDGLSPLKRLKGGFGFVTDMEGRVVESVERLREGQELNIRFADGSARTKVLRTEKSAVTFQNDSSE